MRSRSTVIVWIAIAVFVVFFGVTNWVRQVNLVTSQFDMGNMDQTLWHSLQGRWFQMTDPFHPVVHLRTAIHADYLLLVYLPFYALFPDPRTPLVLQVLAVASGAIPLFWLGRKRLGERVGALIAVAYLFYPTLQWAITFDVHAVALATPLFLWAWWAATERRWWLYYAAIVLAVLSKEEVGLVVAFMGLYWVWRRGYRTMGLVSLGLGLAWPALMLGWAIPSARNAPGHFALGYYSEFGDSASGVVKGVLLDPFKALGKMFNNDGLVLFRALLLPVGAVALLGLPVLLVALPELAVNLLSNNASQHTIFFQYMSAITPFIFLATIDGWDRARRLVERWRWRRVAERGAIVWFVLAMLVSTVHWSPLPWPNHFTEATKVFRPSPYRQDVDAVLQDLRPTDRVAATSNIVPQFSRRDLIWAFPNDLEQADAVIVLATDDGVRAAVEQVRQNPEFTLVRQRDQFWYFRRNP
jgi:uncharacterized membrane protein